MQRLYKNNRKLRRFISNLRPSALICVLFCDQTGYYTHRFAYTTHWR